MAVIGDATVKVRIDTTEARAQFDRTGRDRDRREKRETRQERQRQSREKRAERRKAGRRRFALPSARGAVRGLPFLGGILAGGVLLAEFGPAAAQLAETVTKRVLADVSTTTAELVSKIVKELADVVTASAEKIAELEALIVAVFGGIKDTTQLAKTAWLFRGDVDPQDLKAFLEGQIAIRKALGLGRWAERQIRRKAVSEGLGNAFADAIKTQEG